MSKRLSAAKKSGMKKQELLKKFDYAIVNFEDKVATELYPAISKVVDESGLKNDKKAQCKEIIKKLNRAKNAPLSKNGGIYELGIIRPDSFIDNYFCLR